MAIKKYVPPPVLNRDGKPMTKQELQQEVRYLRRLMNEIGEAGYSAYAIMDLMLKQPDMEYTETAEPLAKGVQALLDKIIETSA